MRSSLMVGITTLGMALSMHASAAPPAPFAHGDASAGKTIVERDCVACHVRQFDGDADRIYLRPDHRVKTPAQLLSQVSYCNTQLKTQYFPDEEEHIAAYLNERYYHFPP